MSEASQALQKIARGTGIVFAGSVLAYPVYPKVYKV